MNNAIMKLAIATLAVAAAPQVAQAQLVTHTADQLVAGGITPTPPFGTLTQTVGTAGINFGVDYSFGNREGIFNDPPFALCGIDSSNQCSLLSNVDGRIVQLGTTNQGFTSFLSIAAGSAGTGALRLSVFDVFGNQLTSVTGNGPLGPFTISRATADIASFSIGGPDTFGVQSVTLGTPIGALAGVPEPATWAMMIAGFGMVGGAMRRRAKLATRVSFAA